MEKFVSLIKLNYSLWFCRWEGADNDYEGILAYIEDLYKQQDKDSGGHKIHCISANLVDAEDFSRIYPDLQDIILANMLKQMKQM